MLATPMASGSLKKWWGWSAHHKGVMMLKCELTMVDMKVLGERLDGDGTAEQ